MNSQQAAIADAMVRERQYQQKKWGDNPHEIGAWITIVRRELREAEDAWCEGNNAAGLEELLQVASVVMACLEQHGIVERPHLAMLLEAMPDPEASKARVGQEPIQSIDWSQFQKGDQSFCSACGQTIRFNGASWDHQGVAQPRHIGLPTSVYGVAAIQRPVSGQDAIRRASVGPLPGDVAICLHCQDQIVFGQHGNWRHHEKGNDQDHTAEPIPF